ncbi:MAG: hypothetical protein C0482_08005 [Gordonia sp.]|nr:hypothetical protein [Gordonia sp. (in: high G+C Gram-positive bacteria)]
MLTPPASHGRLPKASTGACLWKWTTSRCEFRHDRREFRHDRREFRHDRREFRHDRREFRHDRRNPNGLAAPRCLDRGASAAMRPTREERALRAATTQRASEQIQHRRPQLGREVSRLNRSSSR